MSATFKAVQFVWFTLTAHSKKAGINSLFTTYTAPNSRPTVNMAEHLAAKELDSCPR